MIDMVSIVGNMFSPLVSGFWHLFFSILRFSIMALLFFLLFFLLRYKLFPQNFNANYLSGLFIKFKPYDLIRWLLWDVLTIKERIGMFCEYGFTVFVGRQGSGKTISMIQYLNEMRRKYPKIIIVTNFRYKYADRQMQGWRDLFDIRNGTDGVIFAIDEIHSEYSSASWKDFPESILSEISQQRKQRIKIVATAQVYSRIAKPIRDQCFSIICCNTLFGRWTRNREYDAAEYVTVDTPYQVKKKVKILQRSSFIQSNFLRSCYDTYEKIERLQQTEFMSRADRR